MTLVLICFFFTRESFPNTNSNPFFLFLAFYILPTLSSTCIYTPMFCTWHFVFMGCTCVYVRRANYAQVLASPSMLCSFHELEKIILFDNFTFSFIFFSFPFMHSLPKHIIYSVP